MTYRTLAATCAVTLSLIASSAAAAHADRPTHPSAMEGIGAIAEVDSPVPLSASTVDRAPRNSTLSLDRGSITVKLPAPAHESATVSDGRFLVEGTDAPLIVTPTTDGAQILVSPQDAAAPTRYDFTIGGHTGLTPRLEESGAVSLTNRRGVAVAAVEAPWAFDATGRPVRTHFVVSGNTITQVIDHRDPGVAYPVIADPKVSRCGLLNVCVTLSKKETRKVNDSMLTSLKSGVATLCGLIPNKGWGLAVKVVCAAAVAQYFVVLKSTFKKAKKQGRCVRLTFSIVTVAPPSVALTRLKVVKC